MSRVGPASEAHAQRTFQIRGCLGRGGFGEVYLATMASVAGLRSEVAVKVLRGDIDLRSDAVRRLKDEGRLLASLNHPAILRVLDFATIQGRVALVMEYIPGEDLNTLVAPRGLPVRPLLEVIGTVADALDAAWSHRTEDGAPLKLVHRDIKPSNIRISRHGQVRLLDFGIAWSEDASRQAHTADNATVGSLLYMAPERFRRGSAPSAADVYALGCTAFEALAGTPLFQGSSPIDMVQRAASRAEHDAFIEGAFESRLSSAPADVRALLSDALCWTPEGRPSAATLAHRCEALIEALPGPRLKGWAREHPWPEPAAVESQWVDQVFVDGTTTTQSADAVRSSSMPLPPVTTGTLSEETFLVGESRMVETPAVETQHFVELGTRATPPTVEGPVLNTGSSASAPDTAMARPVAPMAAAPLPTPPRTARPHAGLGPALGVGLTVLVAALVLAVSFWPPAEGPQPPTAAPPAAIEAEAPKSPEAPEPGGVNAPVGTAPPETQPEAPDPAVTAPPAPPAPPAPTAPSPRAAPSPAPIQVPAQSLTPAPPDVPAPPAPSGETVPAPTAPAAPPQGRIAVEGAARAQLRSGELVFPTGELPAGRYALFVDFGTGEWVAQGSAWIPAGGEVYFRCNRLKFTCEQR